MRTQTMEVFEAHNGQPFQSSKPEDDEGFVLGGRGRRPNDWPRKLGAFHRLMENRTGWGHLRWKMKIYEAMHGKLHGINEAMAPGDFGTLFTDALFHKLLMEYEAIPKQMRQICEIVNLTTLTRAITLDLGLGLRNELSQVGMGDEYPEAQKDHRQVNTIQGYKYGARLKMFFETWIEDQGVGFFNNLAQRLAIKAANTEEKRLHELFLDSGGIIDDAGTFFNEGTYGQNTVATSTLSNTNLETAISQMGGDGTSGTNYRDDSTPVLNRVGFLVCSQALEYTARGILEAARLGNQGNATVTLNQAALSEAVSRVDLIVSPWIPVIATSNASTLWMLFSDTIKPAALGLLQGHETPEITVKDSNHSYVGGGQVPAQQGDFETDSWQMRVRWIQGECTLDELGGWASQGSG